MNEDNQTFMAPSFIALYVPAGKQKPSLSAADLAARYELCEDMAQLLSERSAAQQFAQDLSPEQALGHCLQGLRCEPRVVSEAEAQWVICRMAELLNWPVPEPVAEQVAEQPPAPLPPA